MGNLVRFPGASQPPVEKTDKVPNEELLIERLLRAGMRRKGFRLFAVVYFVAALGSEYLSAVLPESFDSIRIVLVYAFAAMLLTPLIIAFVMMIAEITINWIRTGH